MAAARLGWRRRFVAIGPAAAALMLTVLPAGTASAGGSMPVHPAQAVSAMESVHADAASFGSGWNHDFAGGSADFDGVACPTTSVCYVSGLFFSPEKAVVYVTRDGGATFQPSASISGVFFDDIGCVSATVCVATGGTDLNNPGGGRAYYTTNGSSWNVATFPAGTKEVNWVKCVSAGRCYASDINGVGYSSADGGHTWTAFVGMHPTGFGDAINQGMAFVSPTHGWYVGGSCGISSCRGFVQELKNGTWTVHTPAGVSALDDIACGSSTECLAVGYDETRAVAYMTYDAGVHWVTMALPFGMNFAYAVACPDANHCYIVGSSGTGNNLTGSVVFATTNAGRSWQVQPVTGGSALLGAIACPSTRECVAGGFGRAPLSGTVAITYTGGVPSQGYWFTASDGGIFAFHAPYEGSEGGKPLTRPIVGMALDREDGGYWEVASDGGIFTFDAPYFGSEGGAPLTKPIVAMAGTFDGLGYYLVASDGGIFTHGDAVYYGSEGGKPLNKPIVGMALDRLTGGYWEVASDGGIFTFNAPFLGSTGAVALTKPIVGMAADPATGGYWLVASDGGIFTFGGAHFYGSTGALTLTRPIVGMQPTPDGHGYWLVASDGGVFAFGDAEYLGSTGGKALVQPIVGTASTA